MPLTDTAIKAAKPQERPVKLSDGEGLHLLITPAGGKLWRLAYRFGGKQKLLALGFYKPGDDAALTLSEARQKRMEAKKLLKDGVDPAEAKKARKVADTNKAAPDTNTFGVIAEEFIAKITKEGKASATLQKAEWLLKGIAAPLAKRPVSEITPVDILNVLRPVEAKGNHEAARRARSAIGRVFRYAIATGRAERDVAADLQGALIAPQVTHRAAITDGKGIGKLMASIYGWKRGQPTTVAGLKLLAMLALRPGVLISIES
ncbi:DUF4102 domain-containing protein [Ancylobacter aquaticus]|nr:DUF4102 domain-containing protein [Ancylobacter aquaticus]